MGRNKGRKAAGCQREASQPPPTHAERRKTFTALVQERKTARKLLTFYKHVSWITNAQKKQFGLVLLLQVVKPKLDLSSPPQFPTHHLTRKLNGINAREGEEKEKKKKTWSES